MYGFITPCSIGLERVAEELMGRRKWKLYQEVLARSQLNANSTNSAQIENTSHSSKILPLQQPEKENLALQQQASVENHSKGRETPAIKSEIRENLEDKGCVILPKEEKLETDSRGNSSSITSESSERPVTPIDWKPDEKCYFCVDGKLLTVNEKGDLVAESGPASSEAELANRTSIDSDTDSRDSSPDLELHSQRNIHVNKSVTSRSRDSQPPNMTSFESMAAHLAAVASISGFQSGLGPFCPSLWYHQLTQQVTSASAPTSETPAAQISPPIKDSPSPSDVTGEQPLDLSAKPSPNSSSACGDPKQVFRAKPRMSAVTGRRTYTEEELHSALQDIISGKLGTRRAAVLYGIPRSTLRNKVYKIAMEQKREAHSLHPPNLEELVDADDEDKELSGDEDKDEKLLATALQQEDLARFTTSQLAAAALQKITKGCESNQTDIKPSTSLDAQSKMPPTTPTPQTPPITPNPWLDPNVLLQSLLLTGGLGALPGLMQPKVDDPAAFRELFSNLMIQQEEILKEQMKNSASSSDVLNNGKPMLDPRILMQNLPLLQQQQQQQQHQHSPYMYQNRLPKSETPETSSSVDIVEGSDDPSVILKIPSYKPVAGSSSSGKNGEHLSSPVPPTTAPILSRSPQQPNNLPGISPPLIRQSSESQSPPIFSLRDVIANSISRTFNQQAAKESGAVKTASSVESMEQQKRASISVIKNLGGTDISRFAATPNLLSSNSNNSASQNAANTSGGVGGKGTRPKRGKYRNYDRDSLVEAVKAVQRGEMSVHRAGSYYGVPHSTLEYKVKERHLMRPRKREPKPQPLDDRAGSSSSSSVTSKNTSIPGIAAVSSLDKIKPSLAAQKPALKNNPPFPSTSPNGMKVPIFDPTMAAQLQYTQHLFWPHSTGFSALPMEFPRTPGGSTGPPAFPPNTEGFLASQMIQRFHEESNRLSGSNISTTNTTTSTPIASNKFSANNANAPAKSTREIAESLYDNGGANGSFLDGIIRKTLDRKPVDIPHGALIDQLVKNTRTPILSSNSDQLTNAKTKRPASPVTFPVIDIKRERASPTTSISFDTDRTSVEPDISKESAESLVKMRDGRSIKMEDPQSLHQVHHSSMHRQQSQHHHSVTGNVRPLSIEDLNGSSAGLHEKIGQIKSEKEDIL